MRRRARPDGSRRAAVRLLGCCSVAVALAGCMPEAATSEGRAVLDLWSLFLVAAAAVGGLVWVLLTLAIVLHWRPRGRRSDAEPEQVHGNRLLESLWTIGPVITIGILFALTLGALGQVEARAPQPAVELHAEAYRWGWRFSYPATAIEITGTPEAPPVAVLPVGQDVRVTLDAVDVQHAWYVPQFLYKHDAYPGRTYTFDLLIERPGSYAGQCAEFCGLLHARMPFTIQAVSPAEYERWLSQQAAAAP